MIYFEEPWLNFLKFLTKWLHHTKWAFFFFTKLASSIKTKKIIKFENVKMWPISQNLSRLNFGILAFGYFLVLFEEASFLKRKNAHLVRSSHFVKNFKIFNHDSSKYFNWAFFFLKKQVSSNLTRDNRVVHQNIIIPVTQKFYSHSLLNFQTQTHFFSFFILFSFTFEFSFSNSFFFQTHSQKFYSHSLFNFQTQTHSFFKLILKSSILIHFLIFILKLILFSNSFSKVLFSFTF